jgi:hypothetical protein
VWRGRQSQARHGGQQGKCGGAALNVERRRRGGAFGQRSGWEENGVQTRVAFMPTARREEEIAQASQ